MLAITFGKVNKHLAIVSGSTILQPPKSKTRLWQQKLSQPKKKPVFQKSNT